MSQTMQVPDCFCEFQTSVTCLMIVISVSVSLSFLVNLGYKQYNWIKQKEIGQKGEVKEAKKGLEFGLET